MADTMTTLSIRGYKSIECLSDFPLRALNVLIGPNGAGKSNFVSFFRFLRALIDGRLQLAVQQSGGADSLLYMGPKVTHSIGMAARFGMNGYDFTLVPTADGRLVFEAENTLFESWKGTARRSIGSGNVESNLMKLKDQPGETAKHGVPYYVYRSISNWVVYHFHDTSELAGVRRYADVIDNEELRADGSNLASYLYRLLSTHPAVYSRIVSIVRLAAPFFSDFRLRPNPVNPAKIQLEWLQTRSELLFGPSALSDGTLRFMCLATALLQPNQPATMIFDEPELGLHPYALVLLGRLLNDATKPFGPVTNQVIVSTQSSLLLNEFSAEDVIVVERREAQSTFTRLRQEDLSVWLEDYSLGELWQKNLLGGRPHLEYARTTSEAKLS